MVPIFLITGSPASGKSTASRALAATFPKSIAIHVDDLRSMVVSGVVHPSGAWSDDLTEQLQLVRQSVTEMAKIYHAAGFAVVIDDFYDPYTQLAEYTDLFGQPYMQRVVLYPDQQKAQALNRKRSGPGELQEYLDGGIEHVYAALRNAEDELRRDGWHLLDTTDDTVEDTVARLQGLVA